MVLMMATASAQEQPASRAAQLLEKIPAEPKAPAVAAPLVGALPPLEFYRALQPGVPGLEAVYEAVGAEDVERAQSAFATYLRTKEFDPAALEVLPVKEAGIAKTGAGEAAAARKSPCWAKPTVMGRASIGQEIQASFLIGHFC